MTKKLPKFSGPGTTNQLSPYSKTSTWSQSKLGNVEKPEANMRNLVKWGLIDVDICDCGPKYGTPTELNWTYWNMSMVLPYRLYK